MNNSEQHIIPIELLTKYFANEATRAEIEELEEWRNKSAENQKEFDSFKKLWNITGQGSLSEHIDIDNEWQKMEVAIAPKTKTFTLIQRSIQIAASVIVLFTLAFLGLKQTDTIKEKTSIAESTTITLPDGSTVSLNAGSVLSYSKAFGTEHRKLKLKGEAYFEVKKDLGHPFEITADKATIKVIGTKFNVKAYKNLDEVRVLVTNGRVQLFETNQPDNRTILEAGETGSFHKEEKKVKKVAISDYNDIAWKTLTLDFNNAPLSEVISVISNTYHVRFVLAPAVEDCPITVKFENQKLSSVLRILKSTLNLKISESSEKNTLLISGQGCR